MHFTMTSALALVSTYGDPFTAESRAPAHVLAESFPGHSDIQAALDKARKSWPSPAVHTLELAMDNARGYLEKSLSPVFGGRTCTLPGDHPSYVPIVDDAGNVIGHETITWVLVNGESPKHEVRSEGHLLGMVLCVYIAIDVEPPIKGTA